MASKCPCAGGHAPPGFVGTSYRCEGPRQSIDPASFASRFYDFDDVLFDGAQIDDAGCVDAPESAPGFYVATGSPSADAIELRLMCDQETTNEDTAVLQMELWGR